MFPVLVGTGGAATLARGSLTGEALGSHEPLPTVKVPKGCVVWFPVVPKSAPRPVRQLPVSGGPAWERSMVALSPLEEFAVVLVELIWMLRCGPPQIVTEGLPLIENDPER